MSGSHRSGSDRGRGDAGEYPRHPAADPRRPPLGDRAYRGETGPHETGSGPYRSGSGGYHTGGYHTGSHRVVRDRRTGRRWAVILGTVGAGIGICVLAVVAVLTGVGASGDPDDGRAVGSAATESAPVPKGERTAVPDSCAIVAQDLVDRLAPGAQRTEADNYQGDEQQNQCVWGAYAGDAKRQLTIELRAVPGTGAQTATDAARARFTSERAADESGKALLAGQKLTDKARLTGVGDDGYVVYSVDDGQGSGEAVGNVRLGNVLITIHYSGSDDGEPLSSQNARGGAVDVAKAVIQSLGQS
ncbi:hypothetical protein ETD83_01545 [Actinomadura soli]|uniref:DUF3558 domain-containing protein n=1 Tax=Actinomadura soli TaxID=2508997 RepID=A0A5C4JJE2_9ACTN|nr:hypothetical protein [Actinomadura soli]TMR07132.1 hypothetical protein ETD83_01545 [Actinomadura soli]